MSSAKTTWQQLELPLTKTFLVGVRAADGTIQHYEVQDTDVEAAMAQIRVHFPGCPVVAEVAGK